MTNATMGERRFGLLREVDVNAERYIYMADMPGLEDYAIVHIRPVLVRKNKKRLIQSGRYQVVVDLESLGEIAPSGLTSDTLQPFKRLMAGYTKAKDARMLLRNMGNDNVRVAEFMRVLLDAGLIKDAVRNHEGVVVEEHGFDGMYRIRLTRNSYKECVIECFEKNVLGEWEPDYRKIITREDTDASIDKMGRLAVKSLIAKMMVDDPHIRFERIL